MKNEMIPFEFEGIPVKAFQIRGELWFRAKDVCKCLGLKNVSDACGDLDADEKQVVNTIGLTDSIKGPGRPFELIVNEPGLYRLIFKSHKPAAKRFKRWVTHEVLPSIHKTERYATSPYKARMFANLSAVPRGYFSIIHELYPLLVWRLESQGHYLPDNMLPDGSVGKLFCAYLREELGEDPDDYPTYKHIFRYKIVYPKAYPERLLPAFRKYMRIWEELRLEDYFGERDLVALGLLMEVTNENPCY